MTATLKAHIICGGRVQGVGFRWFARDSAICLNISGWIKNLPNNNVEIEAVSNKETLNEFLEVLKKGNGMSRVTDLKINFFEAEEGSEKSEFVIKF